MSYTIFYAWQSDSDQKSNRFFIRDAIKAAVDTIISDATLDEAPEIDHDTKGVSGTPDIFQAILEKIDTCGIFIADVTPVTTFTNSKGEFKTVPNPNVMLETGYALAKIGDRRLLTVMNTALGDPKEAPFDWSRRRFPIQYNLPSSSASNKNLVFNQLVKDIVIAIKSVVTNGPVTNLDLEMRRRLQLILGDPNQEVEIADKRTVESCLAPIEAQGIFQILKSYASFETLGSIPKERASLKLFVDHYTLFRRSAAKLQDIAVEIVHANTEPDRGSEIYFVAIAYSMVRFNGNTDDNALRYTKLVCDFYAPDYYRKIYNLLKADTGFSTLLHSALQEMQSVKSSLKDLEGFLLP
jgi:hypothetical protein